MFMTTVMSSSIYVSDSWCVVIYSAVLYVLIKYWFIVTRAVLKID